MANLEVRFVGIPIVNGCIGFQAGWPDATASATLVLETTSYPETDAPLHVAGTADQWLAVPGLTITGPTAAGAGQAQVNLSNIRQQRARLRMTAAANNTRIDVLDGITDT